MRRKTSAADSLRIRLQTERPVYGGAALGRYDGKVCFVEGAIPGECVEARITEEKSDYFRAATVAVLEPSPDRIAPACPLYGTCGGCQQQHIAYHRQISLKQEILTDTLRRIGKLDVALAGPLADAYPWAYRHRAQFKSNGSLLGFYRAGSRDIVDVVQCPVLCEGISSALKNIRAVLNQNVRIASALSDIHVVSNNITTAALCRVRIGSDLSPADFESFRTGAELAGLIIQSNHQEIGRLGEPVIVFNLLGLPYAAPADSFFQGHWRLNERVVAAVRDALQPLGKRVLDLYAGAGNFSLALAAAGAEVTAVEEHAGAVASGRDNCTRNRIDQVRFVQSPLERYVPDGPIDAIVLDPPRPGLANCVTETVLQTNAQRIVYVSCNPSTFARDLRKLSAGYAITEARLIDFFPQTYHIEAMAVLEKKR